ncbi:cysteine--tRNA ligase [Microcoleus sp. S13_B4]|uniref:cysteine--tRNA ligase n=1 Tax=Microcoleus sp. S13_B4 TaxID=3055408 RepID=UPI002FD23BA2
MNHSYKTTNRHLRDIKLFNSLTGLVEIVKPKTPGVIKFYACGPTVYSYAHIGNFRSFLTADLIVRIAKVSGYSVTFVSNITDVGHLSVDDVADAGGQDKMVRALKGSDGNIFRNVWDLARYYTSCMEEDWKSLNLSQPDVRPRATEHITEQLELIESLCRQGFAYETSMGVYFEISKFPQYGALSGNILDQVREGTRDIVSDPEKRSVHDFALWKKDKAHLMRWHSPYGWGFPGWHIECSAMAMKYLGASFDIHSGGEDNRFPHHECEIAQSEALTGMQYVSTWVHTAHLLVEGRRMAKSSGNFFTVREILGRGIDPLALRYALTCSHYRDNINFTEASLEAAIRVQERIRDCYNAVKKRLDNNLSVESTREPVKHNKFLDELLKTYDKCLTDLLDDLNTSSAYSHLIAGIRLINSNIKSISQGELKKCLDWFDSMNELTGLVFSTYDIRYSESDSFDEAWVREQVEARNEARSQRDFKLADKIRDTLLASGVKLFDEPNGTEWRRI